MEGVFISAGVARSLRQESESEDRIVLYTVHCTLQYLLPVAVYAGNPTGSRDGEREPSAVEVGNLFDNHWRLAAAGGRASRCLSFTLVSLGAYFRFSDRTDQTSAGNERRFQRKYRNIHLKNYSTRRVRLKVVGCQQDPSKGGRPHTNALRSSPRVCRE